MSVATTAPSTTAPSTTAPSTTVAAAIQGLQAQVQECNVSGLDASALSETTKAVRGLERSLAGLTTRIGQRANQLSATGQGPAATENSRGAGEVSDRKARTEARRAKAAEKLPLIGDALSNGETSEEHIDAVASALGGLNKEEAEAFAEQEGDLAAAAKKLPPENFRNVVRRAVEQAKGDNGEQTAQAQRCASSFTAWTDRTGMGHFRGSLDPERFSAFTNAIQQHTNSLAAASDGTLEKNQNLAAAALFDLVCNGLGSGGRAHLSLVVDHETAVNGPHGDTVRETSDGHPISHTAARRLLCDAVIQRVVLDPRGVPINVGRKHRTATDAQWVALRAMYSTCALCDLNINWCQAHHIDPWIPPSSNGHAANTPGGQTNLDNLVPLCSHHHHLVHEGGYIIELLPDRTLHLFRPDRSHWKTQRPDRMRSSMPKRE